MSKVSLYICSSIDGYIARENGDVDWLPDPGPEVGDCGFGEFLATVDVIVMGRKSWEFIEGLNEYPYGEIPSFVFSTSRQGERFVSGDVGEFVAQHQGKKIWLMGGGELAKEFFKAGLVDEIIWTILPVVLGEGIPLFCKGLPFKQYSARSVEKFEGGFVQICYE